MTQSTEFLQLLFRVYANRLYQQDRWRILERRENFVKAASVVLGTAAFADVKGFFGSQPEFVAGLVLAFVTVNVVSLVFQWGAKARDAAKRSGDWTTLERDMQLIGQAGASDDKLNQWRARCAEIETSEPSTNAHMQWLAQQRAAEALDVELEQPESSWQYIKRYWPRPWPRAIS